MVASDIVRVSLVSPVSACGTLTAVSVEENGTSFTYPVVTFSLEMASEYQLPENAFGTTCKEAVETAAVAS